MRVNRFHALTMERTAAGSSARGQTNGNGTRNLGAPIKGRGVVNDLIKAGRGKIGELHFDDGPHAFDGSTDGSTDDGVFADGRIHDASGKFSGQIFCGLESSAEGADILAVNKYARIIFQGFGLGFADGFEVGDAHGDLNIIEAFA